MLGLEICAVLDIMLIASCRAENLDHARNIFEVKLGDEHGLVGEVCNSLGIVYDEIKSWDQALREFRHSRSLVHLSIRKFVTNLYCVLRSSSTPCVLEPFHSWSEAVCTCLQPTDNIVSACLRSFTSENLCAIPTQICISMLHEYFSSIATRKVYSKRSIIQVRYISDVFQVKPLSGQASFQTSFRSDLFQVKHFSGQISFRRDLF